MPPRARVKGTNVIPVVRTLRTLRASALGKLAPGLHHYLEERILAATWYPEDDFQALLRVMADLVPVPRGADVWEIFGKTAAQSDLNGLYRGYLRPGDPAGTLRHAPAHWRQFHDSGELSVELDGAGAALIGLRGYQVVSAEMCRLLGGYFAGTLLAAGVTRADAAKRACTARGDDRCLWRLTWS